MEKEQDFQESSISETDVDTTETETPVEKKYSEEDINKAVQSAAGKAKGDILKELGISSVKEFKELKKSFDEAVSTKSELESKIDYLSNQLVCKELNVKNEYRDDFIDLAKKRIKDGITFEEAAKTVSELYPSMLEKNSTYEKTGIEKKNNGKSESKYSEELLKKYPYLKNVTKK